ncbi:hypothetical protein Pen02_74450 [Plantactinospora endophytica]|uniref:Uncharacterized protein n=1 Tax=Plantactinospora endophytica TaxID=673535 RepID=A0ABQ4ECV8_9ACTN|nr:hypothetical protein Pen02_74450 [Plantactinospora endophytica]
MSSPVLNERDGQSTYQPQALKPRVIESPRLAIEAGGGPGSALAGLATSPTEVTRTTAVRSVESRVVVRRGADMGGLRIAVA